MRRMHQLQQGPHRLQRRTLISPHHNLGGEDVHRAPFRHPGCGDPIKISDDQQINASVVAGPAQWPGRAAACGVSAAGPGVADALCRRGDRAVRFLVSAYHAAGGVRPVRTATQLSVLTMVTGYARWASAVLVPTRRAEDLYAGWWQDVEKD